MSELIVLAFDNEEGALQVRDKLLEIQKRRMLQLADAAVVVRRQDGKVKVKQLHSLVGGGAFGGAFWGLLIGLLFAAPWLGLAVGAAAGATIAGLSDFGVDDKFIQDVGNTIQPGHSALFLLVHTANLEKWLDDIKEYNPTVLQTTLSKEDEAKLQGAFGAQEVDA
ncbi:MAG TPA: DUF1269 domain-containing protein [Anaerolineae bacterium]|nr:DUF1269 domain-containing protein [Anaerolineae bacterium]